MIHNLKTDTEPFEATWSGNKDYEIRKNDRDFKVGDTLNLCETVYSGEDMAEGLPLRFTGRNLKRLVTYILEGYGLQDGWVILSTKQQD